ncbi:MAG: hypothetical protein K0V04_00485, partial [Deltaproteobacteria bacterium]|nr:hypothetical protein [Deltaproteobacteria bacterium]
MHGERSCHRRGCVGRAWSYTRFAFGLAVVLPTTAAAADVDIGVIDNGAFVGAPATVQGTISGIAPANADVRINGVAATVSAAGNWSVPYPAFAGQSPQHGIVAELYDAATGLLLAKDRITHYDLTEYNATTLHRDSMRAFGAQARLDERIFADLSTMAADEASLQVEDMIESPALESLFVSDAPELDVQFPIEVCTDLDTLQIGLDFFSLGAVELGVDSNDLAAVTPSTISLCVQGVEADLLLVDVVRAIDDIPDIDGDGQVEPFLDIDAVPDALDVMVTLGPLDLQSTATLHASIEIHTTVPPLEVSYPFDVTVCGFDASVDAAQASVQLALEPDMADPSRVDVEQTADSASVALHGFALQGTSICSLFNPLLNELDGPVAGLIEN